MTDPLVERMRGFGTTIFAEMSALAVATGSVNLGQGFPDTDGPAELLEAAATALRTGHNQYPPGPGIPELRRAISEHQRRCYGLDYDPDAEVLVTAGATEAIAAAVLALAGPGDEVVVFEPYYDSYTACVALAGARHRSVTIERDGDGWGFDPAALEAAIGPATKALILNTPHNPTGTVFGPDELAAVADAAIRHDLVVISDEVYEHLLFDGRQHVPIATLPGMRERTVTISSAGKTFSVTGWKVGWACAPAPLLAAVRTVKQFLTYVNGAPFQPAVAQVAGPGGDARPAGAARGPARPALRRPGRARLGRDPARRPPTSPPSTSAPTASRSAATCPNAPESSRSPAGSSTTRTPATATSASRSASSRTC